MSKVCVLTILLGCFAFASGTLKYSVRYIDQPLDHFNKATYGYRTYKERYLLNDDYYRAGGPIFIYCGNEGNILDFWDNSGFIFTLAEEFNALIVFGEHRYFGKSLPFGQASFQNPQIGLLTIDQVLADYANLISYLKSKYGNDDTKVIAFGGSYGAILAAFFRFKYPNIVTGSLAASAPLSNADNKTAQETFWPTITEDYRSVNPESVTKIESAFKQLDYLSKIPNGYQTISETFHLCDNITNAAGYKHLLLYIRNAFTTLAMYDYPMVTNFSLPLPAWPVNVTAEMMLKAETPIDGLFQVTTVVYAPTSSKNQNSCYNLSALFVECCDPTGCGLGNAALGWDYLCCNQLALATGSYSNTSMFPNLPFTTEDKKEYCQKRWNITPEPKWYALEYFGSDVFVSSNIIFSNGLLDPWHGGGILKPDPNNPSIKIVLIPEAAHHLDLRPLSPSDPPSLVKAHEKEISYIQEFLNSK